jgi:adenylate cyclase
VRRGGAAGLAERNAGTPPEKRIEFRAGINLGDVIAERDDIFGDGVNVAARLEALAEPGGICISRVVRDQIRDKLPYPFEDKGEQSVKNLARPVRVYALRTQGVADPRASNPSIVPRGRTTALAAIAAAFYQCGSGRFYRPSDRGSGRAPNPLGSGLDRSRHQTVSQGAGEPRSDPRRYLAGPTDHPRE